MSTVLFLKQVIEDALEFVREAVHYVKKTPKQNHKRPKL